MSHKILNQSNNFTANKFKLISVIIRDNSAQKPCDLFCFQNFHTFSMLFVHFGQIHYFFKVLKTEFTIQYFVTFKTIVAISTSS